jgi:beta-galactosidase
MKRPIIILFLFLLASCSNREIQFESDLPFERKISINEDWKFHAGDLPEPGDRMFDDASWRVVNLPHDWAIEGPFSAEFASGTGYLPGGIGWYQKHLTIPGDEAGKRYTLMFDGAYQKAEVWVNGSYLGGRPYGYISFYFDITDYIHPGSDNIVTVKLDHTIVSDSRWYTGNGIYRNVWLITTNSVAVDTWGTFIATPSVSDESAGIRVEATIRNTGNVPQEIFITSAIIDRDDKEATRETMELQVPASGDTTVHFYQKVENPWLWSPESPEMYTSAISIHNSDGTMLDQFLTPFGIRDIVFTPDKGLFCNGKSYKLKGVCMHHDYGALGAARIPEAIYPVLVKLKEAGCNAIRTSHNPEDPEYLNMLDTMGFFVIEEAFDEFKRGKKKWIKGRNVGQRLGIKAYPEYYNRNGYSDFYEQWARRDIQDMVRRDRNHPSIIMWSIGNETDYPNDPYQDPNVKSTFDPTLPPATEIAELVADLTSWVREMDTTRAVTQALANTPVTNSVGVPEMLDVVGYNYQEQYYQQDHERYPSRVIYGSENGDSPDAWKAVRDNEFISGQFLWTGMDYHGEAGIFKNHSAAAGIIDYCGFERPGYYFRKSVWTDEPMIKIAVSGNRWWDQGMHWNWTEGQSRRILCYTNCEEAELFLNGISMGKKALDPDLLMISWEVEFNPGTISVNGLVDGQITCTDEVTTAGEASELDLNPVVVHSQKFGYDLIQVEVTMTDKDNSVIPDASSLVEFSLEGEGEIIGVCNSDYQSVESYQSNFRQLYQGRCLVIIKTRNKNEVELEVKSVELNKSYTLKFNNSSV